MATGRNAQRPGPFPELEEGDPGLLYGVFGEEDFLVNQLVSRFLASPAFAQNPSLNIERFHPGDAKPGRILESARTLPFLGSRRLVVLADAHLYKAADLNEFLPYLGDPAPSTCLLFYGQKLNKTTKFAKALLKAGNVEEIKKLYPRQIAPWLKERARTRGNQLEQAAAERLAELSGLGLGALDSELEKLSLFAGKRKNLTLADVEQVVGQGRLYSIFDFTDALAAGELARALSALNQLSALGEPAVRVAAMITRLLRQLITVRRIVDTGGDERQVQRQLHIPPQATHTLFVRARKESMASLMAKMPQLLAADVQLKSSPGSDRVILERLVMAWCRG